MPHQYYFTSSYVAVGGDAKMADASFLVTQPMSAKVKHLYAVKKDTLWFFLNVFEKSLKKTQKQRIIIIQTQ